mmetsp:Transcript_25071/g.81051  ORF Transcript_25071/g.81051 Transcript_25071/m.81051 type:complete len:489 (-) Transcript_25071:17-1483(-)
MTCGGRTKGEGGVSVTEKALLFALGCLDHLDGLDAHEVGELAGVVVVLVGDVGEGLLAAADGLELGDADAGAVELADDVLGDARGAVLGILGDEVGGPEEGEWFAGEVHRVEELGDVGLEGLLEEFVFLAAWFEVGVGGVAADGGEAALGFFVDDHLDDVAGHEDADLALGDAGEEALVDELAPGFLAALEVLAGEGRLPLAGPRGVGAVVAEGEEFLDGVVLDVVVVHLHELELVGVVEGCLAEGLAVVLALEPAEPDALAGGAAVLLDHPRLEGHGLLEHRPEGLGVVVGKGVDEAALHVRDLHEGVLGAHLRLDPRARPHGLALGDEGVHQVVEALLRALRRPLAQLPRVDAHDEGVVLLHRLGELVVLVVVVLDDLAGAPGLDDAVRDGDRIDAVPVRALVRAAVLRPRDVELHDAHRVLRTRRARQELVVPVLLDVLRHRISPELLLGLRYRPVLRVFGVVLGHRGGSGSHGRSIWCRWRRYG